MSAPADQGHAGGGLGAEGRPAWGGQARPSPDREQTGPWALQTHAQGGGGRGDAGSLWLRLRSRGWERGRETRSLVVHRGTSTAGWETWEVVGFSLCCESQASRISSSFFFFETRVPGRRHGVAAVLGKAGAPRLSRPAPTTLMLLISEGSGLLGLA